MEGMGGSEGWEVREGGEGRKEGERDGGGEGRRRREGERGRVGATEIQERVREGWERGRGEEREGVISL